MNKTLLTALVLVGLVGGGAVAAEPSLCTQLADEARRAPVAIWERPDPLSDWIRPALPAEASPITQALASDARWRELLAVSENRPMNVQRLEGSPVYLIDEVAGTANCQSLVLVEASPARAARQLKPPFDLERMNLCMTQSAGFARVLGRPAFVVGGATSMTSPDIQYLIATWSGRGWAQRCRVTWRRHTTMTATQRFCPAGSPVCAAGQSVAQRLAQAYEAARTAGKPLDERLFNGGRRPDAAVAAALNPPLAEPGAVGDMNPPFPLFGADGKALDPMLSVFSNADPRVLPVWAADRWWLAVVGRSGVGWREGEAVLVALFAPPGRAADGVASYQFRIAPAALREVVAGDDPR